MLLLFLSPPSCSHCMQKWKTNIQSCGNGHPKWLKSIFHLHINIKRSRWQSRKKLGCPWPQEVSFTTSDIVWLWHHRQMDMFTICAWCDKTRSFCRCIAISIGTLNDIDGGASVIYGIKCLTQLQRKYLRCKRKQQHGLLALHEGS